MTQKQDELLDEGNLDEQEAKTKSKEVGGDAPDLGRPGEKLPPRPKGRHDEHGAQHRGLKCGGDQDQLAELQKTRAARLPDRHQLWEGAPFEEVEEIGPLVRRWRDVELVAGHEGVSPRSDQSRGACKEVGLIQDVEAVGFIGADPGIVAEIERALAGEGLGFAVLRVRYAAVLDQERGGVETAKQNEALLGVLDTQAAQGLARGGEQLQCIARRQLEPARDAEPTAA